MPKLLRPLLFLWFFVYFAPQAQSQDVQFSQFYAAPLYLNPAMTGATELTRVGTIFRNQWPGLDHSFVSYSAFIDHYIFDYNSGVGLIVNSSRESLANLATDEIGLLYSYRLQLGSSRFLRLGGQVSYINRSAFFGDLVFNSMINLGAANNALSDELGGLLTDAQHRFFNYSFGALYTDTKHWFGVSTHHVTQPSISFLDAPTDEDLRIARLPLKLSLHGGIRFPLGGDYTNYLTGETFERSISFAFNYKQQDPFNQLDLGTQINIDPLVLGLWYRGLPTQNALPNNEAIIALIGIGLPSGIDVGYSFDFTVSRLGLRNSGGAHEVSIRYSFLWGDPRSRNQRSRIVPCFFY